MMFFKWLRRKPKINPKNNPMEPDYWTAHGYQHSSTLCVAYRWDIVDKHGVSMPDPIVSREDKCP